MVVLHLILTSQSVNGTLRYTQEQASALQQKSGQVSL